MSEPKFTLLVASPEYADNGALSHYNLCDSDTGEKIGIFCDEDAMIRNTEKREEQYAKLFAAAPEMYEMLERILDYMTGGPILAKKPSVEEIAHLLEKARGREMNNIQKSNWETLAALHDLAYLRHSLERPFTPAEFIDGRNTRTDKNG